MEETIETKVSPELVWAAWERAQALHGTCNITEGSKGVSRGEGAKGFRYQVLDVIHGKQFSICWKTLFVKLYFTHLVEPTGRGSLIRYQVQIKGLFAIPVRFFLGKKIRENIGLVLKAIVRQLEDESLST